MSDQALEHVIALKRAYHETFSTEEGKLVLADLEAVCFDKGSTIHESSNVMAFQEGHRAVLLHIRSRMNLENLKQILQPEAKGESNV